MKWLLTLAAVVIVGAAAQAAEPATRPAEPPNLKAISAELDRLWREVNLLRGETERLSKEVATLRAATQPSLAVGKEPPPKPAKAPPPKNALGAVEPTIGMTLAQVRALMGNDGLVESENAATKVIKYRREFNVFNHQDYWITYQGGLVTAIERGEISVPRR